MNYLNLHEELTELFASSNERLESLRDLTSFFRRFQSTTLETSKIASSIPVPIKKEPNTSKLGANLASWNTLYSTFIENTNNIFSKITKEWITPIELFQTTQTNIYNENWAKMKSIKVQVNKSKNLLENAKMLYYKCGYKLKFHDGTKHPMDKFTGETESSTLQKAVHIKIKSQFNNYEQIYKYELERYNKIINKINDDYMWLMTHIKQNEESRIYFIKATTDKYKALNEEYQLNLRDFIADINNLVSSEVCDKELKDIFEIISKNINDNKRVPTESFMSYEEYVNNNNDKIDTTTFNYEMINDDSLSTKPKLTGDEINKLSDKVISQLLSEMNIDVWDIAEFMEMLRLNNYEISRRFLDVLISKRVNNSIQFQNMNNWQDLSNILCYISLTQDSIFTGNFELNFKIVYIAERVFYQNKMINHKTYLSAILSKNKYYRTQFFWKNFIELKLANKWDDHILRLRKITLPEENKSSFFSKIGNALGLNNEIKNTSIVGKSPISKILKNYLQLDITKVEFVDKMAIKEMSGIIKDCIPIFANFNFPSEECLDMIAELAEQYKLPKENINYYVTYYNVSTYTIRKNWPNEIIWQYRRTTRYKKVNTIDDKIKVISHCLKYLDKVDYLNLIVLSKKTNEKWLKKIFKIVLKNKDISNTTRWNIWKNILQVKDIRAKFNYQELLNSPKDDKVEAEVRMDVLRTYVGNIKNPEEMRKKITNVLTTIAKCNGNIKYCQGMNYIAEFILEWTNDDEEAFYIFLGFFLSTEYPLIFAQNWFKLKVFFYVFQRIISLFEPELFSYFKGNSVEVQCFMPPWFITLFLGARPFIKENESVIVLIRVLDSFLISGWKSLIKIGISIWHSYENELMKLKYEEMLQFLINDLWKYEFFKESNLENIERFFSESRIQKKWIKNIENEFIQNEKLKESDK